MKNVQREKYILNLSQRESIIITAKIRQKDDFLITNRDIGRLLSTVNDTHDLVQYY